MPDFDYKIDDVPLVKYLSETPELLNRELNRELPRGGGEFAREFTRARLSGGAGIRIRRRSGAKANTTLGPKLPVKMRLAGFTGDLENPQALEGKLVRIRTSNPVMLAHEFGATIRAKSGEGLAIPFSKPGRQRGGRGGREGGDTFVIKSRSGVPILVRREGRKLVGVAFYRREITLRARLGFRDFFATFHPRIVARLDKAVGRVLERSR